MVTLLCVGVPYVGGQAMHARAEPDARSAQTERVARLVARGRARREAGDVISALGLFRDAISAAPRKSDGYVALGELYLELDEPLRALEVFETGTRTAPADEALWLGLSASLSKLGQHERALDALRRLHTLAPTPRGLRALAEAAEARGAFIEALAARRGLVARLASTAPAETQAELKQERAHVRALEILLGTADPVRSQSACGDAGAGLVQRALSRCP